MLPAALTKNAENLLSPAAAVTFVAVFVRDCLPPDPVVIAVPRLVPIDPMVPAANSVVVIVPLAISLAVTASVAISVVPTALGPILALVTASVLISAVVTASSPISVVPTASGPILALVTASVPSSAEVTAKGPILAVVTASSVIRSVPNEPLVILLACMPGIAASSSGLEIRLVGRARVLKSVAKIVCTLVRMLVSALPEPAVPTPLMAWARASTICWKSWTTVPSIPPIQAPESNPVFLTEMSSNQTNDPAAAPEVTATLTRIEVTPAGTV